MLQGYRVLDLTDEKGQLCARMLGDLGADVIKIEPPGGDPSRRLGPFYRDQPDPNRSLWWFAYNSNKRSITLDLQTSDGRELFKALLPSADLVVEAYPPGYLTSLGLGYQQLAAVRPDLVMTSITPYGQTGPDCLALDSDLIVMARGGLLNLCGDEESPPALIPVPQSYCQAGAQGAVASLLALRQRDETGAGQHIDLSMQEAVANSLLTVQQSWDLIRLEEGRGVKQVRGKALGRLSWPCADGHIAWQWWVAPGWGARNYPLLEWMAEEDMAGDLWEVPWEEKSTADITQDEVDHWEEVYGRFFMTHTKAEIFKEALKRRIMLFPTFTPADLLKYEHLQAREYFVPVWHPELGSSIAYPGAFVKTSEAMWALSRRPPLIGEHNREVYAGELGLSPEELAVLKASGAI